MRISHVGFDFYSAVLVLASRLTEIYPVELLLLTLEFRERYENLGRSSFGPLSSTVDAVKTVSYRIK